MKALYLTAINFQIDIETFSLATRYFQFGFEELLIKKLSIPFVRAVYLIFINF